MSTGREFDVIVAGGGASGTCAAVQAARMGARVLVVEETPWLGGMLTTAGVTALDGNDAILSGIHREFVHALWEECGGRDAVFTGWVSRTMYAPSVGQRILRRMVDAEPNVTLWLETAITDVISEGDRVVGVRTNDGRAARAHVTVDATEWGDVIAMSGAAYRLGRESRAQTGEASAPEEPDGLVQDFTWVVTARDFGPGADRTIPAPPGYDPAQHDGCALEFATDPDAHAHPVHTFEAMLSYGRCPDGLFMLNWPIHGNDFYVEGLHEMTRAEREGQFRRMKDSALGYLHHIQTVCGHPELGIAEGEHPSGDGLPLIPYVRESRRIEAVTTLTLPDVVDRHADPSRPLHHAGVAVGDYFIDHHHLARQIPEQVTHVCSDHSFPPIQAVTVPLGCLIPRETDGLIAAEKNIGVTHAVNGVTRLQPIAMNIGQAAGALIALAAHSGSEPRAVDVRAVQGALLAAGALLMPLADVGPDHWAFEAIHRIAVTDALRLHDSERRCEFRPRAAVARAEANRALVSALGHSPGFLDELDLTRRELAEAVHAACGFPSSEPVDWFLAQGFGEPWIEGGRFAPGAFVTRAQLAVVLDRARRGVVQ